MHAFEKIVLVADPHVHDGDERPYGLDLDRRLELAVDFINRRHGDAALCLFLGDLTKEGLVSQYESLKRIVGRLRLPVGFALGNHDDRAAFLQVFAAHHRDVNGFVQFVISTKTIACVALDTKKPGSASGELCDARLAWLTSALADLRGHPIMLFLHHPPIEVGIPAFDRTRLDAGSAGKLEEIILRSGCVLRHTFFGHIHRSVFSTWLGAPIASIPSTAHLWTKSFKSSAEIQLYNGAPRLGVAFVDPNRVVLHTQDILTFSGDWPHRTNQELIRTIVEKAPVETGDVL